MDIRDYLEHLKSKPEHVRRRIALGTSLGFTGLVIVGWLTVLSSSGTLALSSTENMQDTAELTTAVAQTQSSFADLLGAASAFQAEGTEEGSLLIIDGSASSTLDTPPDPTEGKTVIPF